MKPKVGVVVPPDNPVVEGELQAALVPRCVVHAARLPVLRSLPLLDRLDAYRQRMAEPVDALAGLGLDALLTACTGASYLAGPDADDATDAELAGLAGCPLRSVAGAIRDALGRRGVERLHVVSPYPGDLTERSVAYWERAGLDVVGVSVVDGERHPYDLGPAELAAVLAEVDEAGTSAEAVLLTGTGVATLGLVRPASPGRVEVLSSISCGIEWLEHVLGWRG